MRIIDGGLLTTVQDLGRHGYQRDGVTPSGAMDALALRLANLLVHNDEGAAGLEITIRGPTVEFTADALVSVCGAELSPVIADVSLPNGRAVVVRKGSVLTFSTRKAGCRAYLAIAGGIDVPVVMGSRSTYLRAGIGGYGGRALRAGDELPIGDPHALADRMMTATPDTPLPFALWSWEPDLSNYEALESRALRFVRGPHHQMLTAAAARAFTETTFQVSTDADRMGYRLNGPQLELDLRDELLSSAVVAGATQVPPAGKPIILTADRQTTGGYPLVGQVVTADLPAVAQKKPGDDVRFEEVRIDEAQGLLRAQNDWIQGLRKEIADAADRSQL